MTNYNAPKKRPFLLTAQDSRRLKGSIYIQTFDMTVPCSPETRFIVNSHSDFYPDQLIAFNCDLLGVRNEITSSVSPLLYGKVKKRETKLAMFSRLLGSLNSEIIQVVYFSFVLDCFKNFRLFPKNFSTPIFEIE